MWYSVYKYSLSYLHVRHDSTQNIIHNKLHIYYFFLTKWPYPKKIVNHMESSRWYTCIAKIFQPLRSEKAFPVSDCTREVSEAQKFWLWLLPQSISLAMEEVGMCEQKWTWAHNKHWAKWGKKWTLLSDFTAIDINFGLFCIVRDCMW